MSQDFYEGFNSESARPGMVRVDKHLGDHACLLNRITLNQTDSGAPVYRLLMTVVKSTGDLLKGMEVNYGIVRPAKKQYFDIFFRNVRRVVAQLNGLTGLEEDVDWGKLVEESIGDKFSGSRILIRVTSQENNDHNRVTVLAKG